jgi:hypothetical protein
VSENEEDKDTDAVPDIVAENDDENVGVEVGGGVCEKETDFVKEIDKE